MRRQHHRPNYQPLGIHQQMALAPLYLLARVIAPIAPFSVVLTDWLSRLPALGSGSRPCWLRTRRRKASLSRSQVPSALHLWKYHYTVFQLGKPSGRERH